jgi:hypothetical protein
MPYLEELNPAFETKAGSWSLLIGPSSLNIRLLQGLAYLSAQAPERDKPHMPAPARISQVPVLDGGNRFDGYALARAARGRTEVLDRISIARAFTCHQMLALLESTPASDGPFIILDLLRTFYDESVQASERKRLLRGCLAQMQRLEQAGGGLVSVHPPALPSPVAVELLEMLKKAAPATIFVREEPQAPQAPRLFQ